MTGLECKNLSKILQDSVRIAPASCICLLDRGKIFNLAQNWPPKWLKFGRQFFCYQGLFWTCDTTFK